MADGGIRFFAATDVGKVREHNEDNFLVDKKLHLFVVADGMGGHAAGEIASAIAVRTLHEELRKEAETLKKYDEGHITGPDSVSLDDILGIIEGAVQRACARIHQEAAADAEKRGMGTTLSALLILGNKGFVAHVGDSRIYLARAGVVQQITEDHTVFNELIKRGRLTREQIERVPQKNAVTRAVGVYERVDVDTLVIDVLGGDKFILASDGLTGYLTSPNDLAKHLQSEGTTAVKSLVDFANAQGGKDNVTVVMVEIAGEGREQAQKFALKREILARMPLFSRLTERELLRVMQIAEVRSFADGDTVITEGQKGDELYIVLHGRVTVSRGAEIISRLGAGEHFGEMALIRSVPRSATVKSDGPCELILLSRRDFFEILRSEHEIAVKMLWQFLGVLANRLDQTSSDLQQARETGRESEPPRRPSFSEVSEATSPFTRRPALDELLRRADSAPPSARGSGPFPPPMPIPRPVTDRPSQTKPLSGAPPLPLHAPPVAHTPPPQAHPSSPPHTPPPPQRKR